MIFNKINLRLLLLSILIFTLFFGVYLHLSLALSKTGALDEWDILFELDPPRVIGDMTIFIYDHYRTAVHPLYVLIINPIGILVNKLVGSNVTTAVIINCFLGSFGVTLGFIYHWVTTKNIGDSVLLALLFGISSSQLILSIVPDTSSLATCSLILTYILFFLSLKNNSTPMIIWIIAGVFSLGVTTTNFLQTVICFGISHQRSRKHTRFYDRVKGIFNYLLVVVCVTALLSVIQKLIYPSTVLFFLRRAYIEDLSYVIFLIIQKPLIVINQLLKYFFWVNLIAPYPTVFTMSGKHLPAITFRNSTDFSFLGIGSSMLWFALIGTGVIALLWQPKKYKINDDYFPLYIGLSLCLLFNLVFHSFYGVGEKGKIEYFLYTGNFTFLTLSIFAIHFRPHYRRTLRTLLIITIALMGMNNYLVVIGIINSYALF